MVTVVQTDFGPVDIDAGEAQAVSDIELLNPAIKGTDAVDGDNPVIILALLGREEVLVVDVNGKFHHRSMSQVSTDWRYDFKNEEWVDANGPLEDE